MAKEMKIKLVMDDSEKLVMDDSEKLDLLSKEILPAMIWQAVDGDRIYAAALATAVTENILQSVFKRFNEEETPHGPRS